MPARTVEFVVVSEEHAGEDLVALIGAAPDELRRGSWRFPRQVAWVLRAAGGADADLSELIEQVFQRLEPVLPAVERLVSTSADTAVLRIIQYIGPSSEPGFVGPGFALDPTMVRTLAKVQAAVDVDQYLVVDTATVDE